jgi:hypothetical protein
MIDRYIKIREFLSQLDIDEIHDLMLSSKENRDIDGLFEVLKDFESVSKVLQRDDTTMADVRALFDAISENYSNCERRLARDAPLVLDKFFESAVVKIQQGSVNSLSPAELRAVQHLKKNADQQQNVVHDSQISFAEQVLKKRKYESETASLQKEYIDLRLLIPTSNICERLFSRSGYALNERRLSILPVNAEAQVFLHLNMDLWNIDTLKELSN